MLIILLAALASVGTAETSDENVSQEALPEDHDIFDCEIHRTCWIAAEIEY